MFCKHINTFQILNVHMRRVATKCEGTDAGHFHQPEAFRNSGASRGNENVRGLAPSIFVY